jgi:TatD DNase family protein
VTLSRIPFFDTHSHLDDEQFDGEVGAVIERAQSSGVRRIVNIGYRPGRWRTTLALADRFPDVAYTLGLHPHHAEEWSDLVESELIELLRSRRPVAVGEIGLDYFRNFNPPDVQQVVFMRQLEIAGELQLPVVIHQRYAETDLLGVLNSTPRNLVCVLHSFEGTAELADFAIGRGYYFGVGGLMTRPASVEVREVLKGVPLNRMLLETDSPYLVPAGIKIRRNEPSNLPVIAERLAKLLEMPVEMVAAATSENAERAFGPLLDPKSVAGMFHS